MMALSAEDDFLGPLQYLKLSQNIISLRPIATGFILTKERRRLYIPVDVSVLFSGIINKIKFSTC